MDYNQIFDWCVETLENMAKEQHMTYKEINVWIFCIIEPVVFSVMLAIIIYQFVQLRKRPSEVRTFKPQK